MRTTDARPRTLVRVCNSEVDDRPLKMWVRSGVVVQVAAQVVAEILALEPAGLHLGGCLGGDGFTVGFWRGA